MAFSRPFRLTVDAAPLILEQIPAPNAPLTLSEGAPFVLSVSTTPANRIIWERDGVVVREANGSSLEFLEYSVPFPSVPANAGTYKANSPSHFISVGDVWALACTYASLFWALDL